MKQVFSSRQTGKSTLVDVPVPSVVAGQLLIQTTKSLISTGTERMLLEFGKSNLIEKVRQNPDRVQQVVQKIKTDGIIPTLNAVMNKLDQPAPIGYCNVGVVKELGQGVNGFKVGDRVLSNGPHAEVVCVPQNLCAKIPDNVDDVTASFGVLSAIALQGIRLINPTLGEAVAVIGLGIIGQLACQILMANGCRVIGFDLDSHKVALAKELGAEAFVVSEESDPVALAVSFSCGNGVDAVLITASTKSNAPIAQAPKMCRKRGRIVLVGVIGLELSRADFYDKEISFQVSCSYGPGRYENNYEKKGYDYPIGHVRWTEQRNFEAILQLMAEGKVKTEKLVSEIIPLEEVERAYETVAQRKDVLGLIFDYKGVVDLKKKNLRLPKTSPVVFDAQFPVVGFIGAGSFTSAVLLPAFKQAKVRLKAIASSGGLSSLRLGTKYGFEINTTDYQSVINDPEINTVVITTQHNSHARFVLDVLKAGKNVFVEKPLCLNDDELKQIIEVYHSQFTASGSRLMVGFNRRFSPCTTFVKKLLSLRKDPLCAVFTANAGFLPLEHWAQDEERGGGRIIGEACHFIDLLRFIVGFPIQSVQALTTNGHSFTDNDKITILLAFEDGSIGTVHYFANGSKDYPKEKLEVFCAGKTIVLNNFMSVDAFGCGKKAKMKLRTQDKGHNEEVKQFIAAIKNGLASPIPAEELFNVTTATYVAVQAAKSKALISI